VLRVEENEESDCKQVTPSLASTTLSRANIDHVLGINTTLETLPKSQLQSSHSATSEIPTLFAGAAKTCVVPVVSAGWCCPRKMPPQHVEVAETITALKRAIRRDQEGTHSPRNLGQVSELSSVRL
jgi:hypothetical protein